jgi:hypothetical protein
VNQALWRGSKGVVGVVEESKRVVVKQKGLQKGRCTNRGAKGQCTNREAKGLHQPGSKRAVHQPGSKRAAPTGKQKGSAPTGKQKGSAPEGYHWPCHVMPSSHETIAFIFASMEGESKRA